jgi:hypothetical protein
MNHETIRIPLGRSGISEAWATIDFGDYERVALYRWYLDGNGYPFIAYAKDRPTTYLHNYVLGRRNADDGMQVDHIDRDPLNACKSNLRIVTKVENMANTSIQDRVKIQEETYAEIARRFYASGLSLKEVAKGLGIPVVAVTRYCDPRDRQENSPRRRPRPERR